MLFLNNRLKISHTKAGCQHSDVLVTNTRYSQKWLAYFQYLQLTFSLKLISICNQTKVGTALEWLFFTFSSYTGILKYFRQIYFCTVHGNNFNRRDTTVYKRRSENVWEEPCDPCAKIIAFQQILKLQTNLYICKEKIFSFLMKSIACKPSVSVLRVCRHPNKSKLITCNQRD